MEYKLPEPVYGNMSIEKYQCTIEWRNGKFITDEPKVSGRKDLGPDPYALLLSSLATSTLITMRKYIDQKGWDVPAIVVNANLYQQTIGEKPSIIIDRDILFLSAVSDEQKLQLQEIASHCPISKILEGDIKVRTFLFRDSETEKKVNYSNDEITVVWKPEFCQHSARCFTQLPEVFNPKIRKWINPNGASTEKIIEQVKRCPSGALTFFYNDKKDTIAKK